MKTRAVAGSTIQVVAEGAALGVASGVELVASACLAELPCSLPGS